MKIAAVDLGTNSFLCLVAEVDGREANRTLKVITDVSRVVRLGEKVHENRQFLPAALKRAEVCLDEFQTIIQKHKVDFVIATATSAARDAKNGNELIEMGKARGIPISIIGGDREAELSFIGAVSGIQGWEKKKVLVVDVGGGSTEFVYKEPQKMLRAFSFDVGCVRLTEMFLKKKAQTPIELDAPLDQNELDELYSFAFEKFKKYSDADPSLVVAVAGTPTTLACVLQGIDFEDSKVEGFVFDKSALDKLTRELSEMKLSDRKKVKGLEPLRADIIVTGGKLLSAALEAVNKNQMVVSTRGLRYGAALRWEEFKK